MQPKKQLIWHKMNNLLYNGLIWFNFIIVVLISKILNPR